LGDRVLSLPMHPYLDQSIQARVVAALKTAVAQ
jgi:dTDP-4-amino-4,6-dideoxygalactose transaminase